MKQCPACGTTYTDETLRFCLTDGGVLVEVAEAETVLRPGVRVDIPSTNYPTIPATSSTAKRNPIFKVVVVFLIVGFLGLLGLGAAGAILYYNSGGTTVAVASPTPTAIPTQSASP